MFFIMGMSQGEKQLDYSQTVICDICGRYGRYEVFMTYMYLSFFFIPLFKWNRQYFVRMSCCGTVYALDPEKGRAIASGADVRITADDLTMQKRGDTWSGGSAYRDSDRSNGACCNDRTKTDTDGGNDAGGTMQGGTHRQDSGQGQPALPDMRPRKICPDCGYSSSPDFLYCPKCGRRL